MSIPTTRIQIERTRQSRISEIDFAHLEFGKYISDHMLVADYTDGQWLQPKVMPFGELAMTPAILSLHYGQAIFEGMKAYKTAADNITIFRLHKHWERLNRSLERLCMPTMSEEMFRDSLQTLIQVDSDWIPTSEGASLYIRPVVFATESRLGVKISDQYKFVIMTSPVGPYYSKPLKIKVEETFVRAAEGGVGFSKCAGNYGASFYPTHQARLQGYDQVLWTDAKEHKYIDEAGTMNVMFVLNGKLVTPKLTSAILDGITRDSILTLAREMDITVEERKVGLDELAEASSKGALTEAFGTGTAAIVAPIATINIHGKDHTIPTPAETSFQLQVKKKLHDIRMKLAPDNHHWNYTLDL
jgi:branched-chain amino acid aminotransferase